jgi:hypothetical protein
MKTRTIFIALVFLAALLINCNVLTNTGIKLIKPSDVVVTETRDVSGFSAIDMSTFGKVILTQGDNESLTIKGSDNIVPLVKTSVRDGTLFISTEENINITSINFDNVLTFTITLKDLNKLTVSGAGNFTMDALSTTDLAIILSGAGNIQLDNLIANSLNINLSGVGSIEVAGEVTSATIDVSGAGGVNSPDLKIQTAEVTISGLGGATLWVTDQLSGDISGGGSVSYYGDPQTNTTTSGIGNFKPLGEK